MFLYMLLFLPNFSLGVLNPHVLVCGFLLLNTCCELFNGFKNIPGKAYVKRVHNNNAFVTVGNKHTRKTLNTAY